MEETLGKRIVQNRKQLGMTQDQLAERLGVTAQAVSKWENDQSCPDITMLPRLAEIFHCSTDALLGIEPPPVVHPAEVLEPDEDNPDGLSFHGNAGNWEFKWDGGRKSGIGMALWILLTGGLLLVSNYLGWGADFWGTLWPSGLLVFGLFGLFPKFSFFRLGCALFGTYFLLNELQPSLFTLGREYWLPLFLLVFGISLLVDALRKDKQPKFQVFHNGERVFQKDRKQNRFTVDGEHFSCCTAFGSERKAIQLSRLSGGDADVSFGELVLDLSGCEEIADDCQIDACCSFGSMTICVPRHFLVDPTTSTAFGSVDISGQPAPDAQAVIHMDCNANFGEIQIRYI